MSNIKENIAITIYNYNPFVLSVNTNITSHVLAPCYDYDMPTSDFVTFTELSFVNSNSTAIRNGLIRFDKSQEAEIYKALQIRDWDKILTNEQIENIILKPNKEGLQRIIDIADASVFDRVLAMYQGLINSGEYDVSNRITNIIETRKREFRKGLTVSKIQLKTKDDKINKSDENVQAIKEQNASLQEQLNKMQEMMAQLMSAQNENTVKKPATTRTRKPKTETSK